MTNLGWTEIAERVTRRFAPVDGAEMLSLQGAAGRILAHPLAAADALPAMTHAVMDGYALGSQPPGLYTIRPAGIEALAIHEASPVAAGGRVPVGSAGVVLADHAEIIEDKLHVRHALAKNNIRREGEEAQKGDMLLPAGTRLDIRHIALAAAAGIVSIAVRKQPRVALLGLHDGLHALPHLPLMHALLDSPSVRLTDAGSAQPALLQTILGRLCATNDLVVVVAESLDAESGTLTQAIETLGGKATIGRANLKPAKPLILGQLHAAQIIGLAGTAYAACVSAHLFLRPALQALLGLPMSHDLLPAQAGFERSRMQGRTEALPARISVENNSLTVTPAGRFGQLRALAAMDGFALVPADADSITKGLAMPYRKLSFPLV